MNIFLFKSPAVGIKWFAVWRPLHFLSLCFRSQRNAKRGRTSLRTFSHLLSASSLFLFMACAVLRFFFAVPRSLLLVVSRRELFFFFLRVIAIVVVERLTSHPVTSAHPQLTASSFSLSSIDGSDVSQTDSCSCSVGRNGRLEHRRFFDSGHSALVRYEE